MIRFTLALGPPLLLAFAYATQDGGAGHGAVPHHDEWGPEQAAQLFAERCSNCHTVPDPRYATDRAWITQIQDTA